jgi:nitroreductase
MEFLDVCGLRRSVRFYRTWQPVEREKIQRILEVVRVATTCPGNLQPWRAVVVDATKLAPKDREMLLAADNYQGAHRTAPIWIYWFADPEDGKPQTFQKRVHQLMDVGALASCHGWTHDAIDASIEKGARSPEGMPEIGGLLHNLPFEISVAIARGETIGACDVACLAAVNEGLGTCLHMVATVDKVSEVKKFLKVPDRWEAVWLQLVGYPAEEPEAGGQRPRLPFNELFFEGEYGKPFPRDEKVVSDLHKEGLLRAPAPKPERFEEIKHLARMFGFPV